MKRSLLGLLGLTLLAAGATNAKNVVLPGAHHFGGKYDTIAETILKDLQ